VDGAAIKYSAIDRFFESGSKYGSYSDENGYFSIENIKGAGLSVSVSKEGYYPIDGKSSAAFAYGVGADSTRKVPPSKDNPAFFELQKMGETEPLVRVETGGMSIPKNGTPVRISPATGLKGSADQATIQVEAWTNNQGVAPNSNQLYDWRFRVSVPGGGLVDRIDQFGFEALWEDIRLLMKLVIERETNLGKPILKKSISLVCPMAPMRGLNCSLLQEAPISLNLNLTSTQFQVIAI